MAARAALWDTKVPRTRSVEYKARKGGSSTTTAAGKTGGSGDMDVDEDTPSGFDTRQIQNATDFELPDYWDEGEVLDGRDKWPVCVTLNLVRLLSVHWAYKAVEILKIMQVLPAHYLDAILQEEAATPLKLLLMFSFPPSAPPDVQAMRIIGPGEIKPSHLKELVKVSVAKLIFL